MKSLLVLLLLTVATQSTASAPVGATYTTQRLVVLTFEGSKAKTVFFINAGQTKEAINAIIKQKTREAVQKCPKTLKFSSHETAFPEIITDHYLDANYPEHASIKLHVIEYEVPKRSSRF